MAALEAAAGHAAAGAWSLASRRSMRAMPSRTSVGAPPGGHPNPGVLCSGGVRASRQREEHIPHWTCGNSLHFVTGVPGCSVTAVLCVTFTARRRSESAGQRGKCLLPLRGTESRATVGGRVVSGQRRTVSEGNFTRTGRSLPAADTWDENPLGRSPTIQGMRPSSLLPHAHCSQPQPAALAGAARSSCRTPAPAATPEPALCGRRHVRSRELGELSTQPSQVILSQPGHVAGGVGTNVREQYPQVGPVPLCGCLVLL